MPNIDFFTGGLYPSDSSFGSIVSSGNACLLNPTTPSNPPDLPSALGLTRPQLEDLKSITTLKDPQGNTIIATADGYTAIGNNYNLGFDPTTLQGRINPTLNPNVSKSLKFDMLGTSRASFTGSDVRLLIELADRPTNGNSPPYKQLLESTTITVSIHREVAPVRASGYINPKGFALGTRTIAGTLILTQFTVDTLFHFLQASNVTDMSKDTLFTKVDQLPPFNITMLFCNEYGYVSTRMLLGVKFVTDGTVYSIQDMMTEQTLSYMALDFTPLMPYNMNNLYSNSNSQDPGTKHEKSPTDLTRERMNKVNSFV